MAAYDGTIRIDTRIDEKGFNKGLSGIGNSLKNVSKAFGNFKTATKSMSSLKGIMTAVGAGAKVLVAGLGAVATVAGAVALGVIAVAGAIAGMAVAGYRFLENYTNKLAQSMSKTSYMYDEVMNLKTAFNNVRESAKTMFSPLLIAAMPIIMKVTSWLMRMFQVIQMIIAALLGQKTVMQYVAGSAEAAEEATGGMADNTKKSGEAAKGALAAFDELNVLQQSEEKQPETGGGGGGAGGGGGMGEFVEKDIDSKILDTVAKIKKWFSDAWDWVKKAAEIAWEAIVIGATWLWDNVLGPVWKWVKQAAIDAWGWVSKAASNAWDWIAEKWGALKEWFKTKVWDPLVEQFKFAWEFNKTLAHNAWATIKYIWGIAWKWFKETVVDPIVTGFTNIWTSIKTGFSSAWTFIKLIWGIAWTWFETNVVDPIKIGFGAAWLVIKKGFETAWTGIKDFAKGIINSIIDLINKMIAGVVSGINTIIVASNRFGERVPGWKIIPELSAPQIPRLATGAVIPPNAEFLAMLGDQRHGTNIEAPEELIRQIVREETGGGQGVTINFAGNMGALVRAMKPYIDKENSRIGRSLVKARTA